MSKFHPVYEVLEIIKSYAVKYNKSVYHAHSLWYFDDDDDLVICTDHPGIWLGSYGNNIEQLKNDLNAAITAHNTALKSAYESGKFDFTLLKLEPEMVKHIEKIKIIECNF